MAEQTISLLLAILFSLLTLLSSPLVSSRSLLSSSKTCTLNVTASLHRAMHYSPLTDQSEQRIDSITSMSASTSLKLQLYPRESLHDTTHNDYKSRVLTRFARDSARASSLQTRLDLAIRGIPKSDLHPLKTKTNAIESPIVSGTSQGSGEYFTRVGIGHPPRQLYVVIDTGSDVSWVQCEPCSVCYTQSDPVYNPKNSTSYMSLSCDDPKCRALDVSECHSGHCLYEVSYGDGSYTVGDFATESLTFTGGAAVDTVAIGCGHNNDGLFVGAGGLLGLGGGTLSFPSQINATSFSYCLIDRDSNSASTLEFHSPSHDPPPDSLSHNSPAVEPPSHNSPAVEPPSHNSPAAAEPPSHHSPAPDPPSRDPPAAGVVAAPLVRNPQLETFYYVGLTGVRVGGERLSLPAAAFEIDGEGNGGVIIDSGTAVTRLETRVYEALRDEFRRGAGHLPSAEGVAIFDTCYDLKGRSSVAVPAVELEFSGGKRLLLPAKNYMIPVDSDGTFCLAFAGTTSSMSIIGNVQQQGTRVEFDLVNSVVTFQPNKC